MQGTPRFSHLVKPLNQSNCKRRTFRTRRLNRRASQQSADGLGKGGASRPGCGGTPHRLAGFRVPWALARRKGTGGLGSVRLRDPSGESQNRLLSM